MTIEFKISGEGGQGGTVDANYVVSQLQQAGYGPQGLSADGMTLTLMDDQGTYEVKTADALKNLGWTVNAAMPVNADHDNVQPGWRAAVHKLPDDDSRRAYIEGQMRKAGVEQPTVVGSGRDWFVFNPSTSQYIAVTNSPDWDGSDLVEGGLEGARLLGSAAGGALGAGAGMGAGSIPGGMAGAALGGAAVDASGTALLSAFDPEFRHQAEENQGAMRGDMAMRAALDAGGQGLLGGLAKYGGSVGKVLSELSPFSRAAKAGGNAMELAGGGIKTAAGALDNTVGRDLAGLAMPGVGDVGAAGFMAQAPEWAISSGTRAMGKLGQSETMQRLAPRAAQWMARQADELTRVQPRGGLDSLAEEAYSLAQRGAQRLGGEAPEAMPAVGGHSADVRTIMENLGGKIGRRVTRPQPRATSMEGYRTAREFGFSPAQARDLADDNLEAYLTQQTMGSARGMGAGRKVGHVIKRVGDAGRALEEGARNVAGGVLKTAKAGGVGMQGTGTALKAAGTLGKPLETRAALRYGSEEGLSDAWEDWNPLRRRKSPSMMDLDLAQN